MTDLQLISWRYGYSHKGKLFVRDVRSRRDKVSPLLHLPGMQRRRSSSIPPTANERTHLLRDCLGCPERDSESAASEPPWCFVPSWYFSERKAMVGSTTGGRGKEFVKAGKGKPKHPASLYTILRVRERIGRNRIDYSVTQQAHGIRV